MGHATSARLHTNLEDTAVRVKMRIVVSEVGVYRDLDEAKEAAEEWAAEIREEYGTDADVIDVEEDK